MTCMSADNDNDHAAQMEAAYAQLRDDVREAISNNPAAAADSVLSLVFDRLVNARPSYFKAVIDQWGADLVDRDIRDASTFRLLFSAVIGQSPINGVRSTAIPA
jgi:hypothetical protein